MIYLVKEGVEGPGQEEADPADGHHDAHLGRGQVMWDPIDVDQLHVGLDAQLCGDGQPREISQNIVKVFTIYPRLSTKNIRK